MGAVRRHVAMLAVAAMVGTIAPGEAAGDDWPAPGFLHGVMDLVAPVVPVAPALPADPDAALRRALTGVAARLNVPVDAGPALARATLDTGLAARLAVLLGDIADCQDATGRLLADLPAPLLSYLGEDARAEPVPQAGAVRDCATRLQADGLELSGFLRGTSADMGSDISLWPVLRLDVDGSDDLVLHDYALSVDAGGDDTYLSNAGGNPLDLMRGPAGSAAPKKAPARGCINPAYDLAAGECTLASALLVDVGGNDTYGQMQPPVDEAMCTADPSVRRVMTAGAGFAGAGILIDMAGDDHYLGKTVTQGAGHIFGVGILFDGAGDDTYTAMRLSKGFGVIFGVGLLRDAAGNDRYDYYMPRALDPAAPPKTPGSGGGFTATGLCDNQPRWDEGTGVAGGIGLMIEEAGDDTYTAGAPLQHLLGTDEPLRTTGSLGFGDFGGFGYMHDRDGRDRYQGMPNRADDTRVLPTPQASGLFIDGSGPTVSGLRTTTVSGLRTNGGSSALVTAFSGHFMPGALTVDQGSSLQFLNPDLLFRLESPGHTFTELRPDGGPPRFNSGLVQFGEAKEVPGVASLVAGRYEFSCKIHPFMRGVLTVR